MTTREAYDARNEADYEEITLKLAAAFEKMEKDSSIPATGVKLAQMAGVSRNTPSNRGYGGKDGPLARLRNKRKEDAIAAKAIANWKKESGVLVTPEDQLENAKQELIFWFNKVRELKYDLDQTVITLNRTAEARDFYEQEMKKERKRNQELQKLLDMMKS